MDRKIHVISARYHRNGSFGAGFYAIEFRVGRLHLSAIVFDLQEHVAVVDDEGDSYRCEDFEPALRDFIRSAECNRLCWPTLKLPANDEARV